MEIKITTLIENHPGQEALFYEHGLSMLIETNDTTILFDTGQTGLFLDNLLKIKNKLPEFDYVVLSHGHYDHSGGLQRLVEANSKIKKLVVGEEFLKAKYKLTDDNQYKYNGNPFSKDWFDNTGIPLKIITKSCKLAEGIWVFKDFLSTNDFETFNKRFVIKDKDKFVTDEFRDEIVLVIETKNGLTVLAGCSHPGIINIVREIQNKTGKNIDIVIGGTHLIGADDNRLYKTINELKNMNISMIAVSHCTGEAGIDLLEEEFGDRFLYNCTGNIIYVE